jgi:hypothetical protein
VRGASSGTGIVFRIPEVWENHFPFPQVLASLRIARGVTVASAAPPAQRRAMVRGLSTTVQGSHPGWGKRGPLQEKKAL